MANLVSRVQDRLANRKGRQAFAEFTRSLKVCPDVAAIARERGWKYEILAPEILSRRVPSQTIPEQLGDQMFDPAVRAARLDSAWERTKYARLYAGEYYRSPEAVYVEIPDATLHLSSGAVFTAQGEYFPQSVFVSSQFFGDQQNGLQNPPPRLEGNYLSSLTPWGWNYAHWLFDSLPKVEAHPFCPEGTKLLMHAGLLPFHRESLSLLGLGEGDITEISGPLISFEKLGYCFSADRSGAPHPRLLIGQRERLLKAAGVPQPAPTGAPIYISRKNRSRSRSQRRIANEADVLKVLEEFGFEAYVPEEHSFPEQVRRFSTASAIACPHGAGSFNHLFAPAGIPVVEFYNPSCWEHAPVRFTSLLGQRHYHLFGRNVSDEHDFELDCARVRKVVALALGGKYLPLAAEREY